MSQQWIRDYMLLALRIDKLFHGFAGSWFVDYYYGPPELKAAVDSEPATSAADLVRAATALLDALSAQGFAPQRAVYLEKQATAMEIIARKLGGETFGLEEEAQRCFDIRPAWIPEQRFEQALALYDEALPGAGALADRYAAWRKSRELAQEQAGRLLGGMVERTLAECRRRTQAFIDLPAGEGMQVQIVNQKNFGAANWYLGNYRSRMELNTDLPNNLAALPDLMAHEGYPGHHVEGVMKEQELYHKRGYTEYAIFPVISPQLVITEGIAMLAPEIIFGPGEIDQWAAEQLYPEAGMPTDAADVLKLRRAGELASGATGNAAFMLHEGRPDDEVIGYLMKYTLMSEERARKSTGFFKVPFMEAYTFTYFYGAELMRPLLQGPDRLDVFRRLLTEQLYPSLLEQWPAA